MATQTGLRLEKSLERENARRGIAQSGECQLGLLARLARSVKRRARARRASASADSKLAAEQARRFGIERRNPGSGFDHQHAAGQAFQNAAQAFADAVVIFETGGQIAVGDFEFLAEMATCACSCP